MTPSVISESHHGVLVAIEGIGVLIKGEPGCGKSSLALALLAQGHQLIADDLVLCYANPHPIGLCPRLSHRLLHSRELGLIDVVQHFGANSWLLQHRVDVVVHLHNQSRTRYYDLMPEQHYDTLCQRALPCLDLSITNPAPLSLRLLTWLKNQTHSQQAHSVFNQHHRHHLNMPISEA